MGEAFDDSEPNTSYKYKYSQHMVSREVYVSGHFRSLLISRFNYTKINSIVRLKSLKIIALVPPSHYEVVALTLFLGTGI